MILGWQYGLLPPLTTGCDPALAWAEDCEREMSEQVAFWNRLTEIELERRTAERRVLCEADPALARLWGLFEIVLDKLEALPRRPPPVSEGGPDPAAWRAGVMLLREQRRDMWAELKPMIAATRTACRDELKALSDVRFEAVKQARNNSGLWWGNYNACAAAFEVALGRLAPGDRLRPHRWDGSGRLTNQLIGGFPAERLTQGHAQLRLGEMPTGHPLLSRGAGSKGKLKVLIATVYSHGHGNRRMAAWPIVLHRPFPPGAIVKSLAIHRRRVGARLDPLPGHVGNRWDWRWTATFSCEITDVPPSTSNVACGIDLGWRLVEGGVRIATIASSDGGLDHVVLPQAWLDHRERLAKLQGEARTTTDQAEGDIEQIIEGRRLRQAATHGIDEASLERREFYRIAAKALTERYGLLGIDGTGIGRMARRKKAGERGQDLPPMARRMRTWGAPGELMHEIERAARSRGCRVEIAAGATTITCHHCGTRTEAAQRADLIWRCRACGALWDQDENAAKNVLIAVLNKAGADAATSGAAAVAIAPRENKGLRRSRGDRKASARKLPSNPLKPSASEPAP